MTRIHRFSYPRNLKGSQMFGKSHSTISLWKTFFFQLIWSFTNDTYIANFGCFALLMWPLDLFKYPLQNYPWQWIKTYRIVANKLLLYCDFKFRDTKVKVWFWGESSVKIIFFFRYLSSRKKNPNSKSIKIIN